MKRLDGRIAAVTAAGSGMGRAVARRLAAEGAHVVVVDLSADGATETAKQIVDAGGSAQVEQLDATDVPALRELFARIDQEHGALHVLHNHVGMPGPAGLDVTEHEWQVTIDVNVKSAFFGCSAAMDVMRKAGRSSIILTASTSAIVGSPFSPIYSLTKGALASFGRSLALVGAPDGIRVNTICPGPVDTPMLPTFFGRQAGADIEDLMSGFISFVPMGRPASPDEIAGVVAFLASDDAGFVTGVTLPIDGGLTIK